MYRPYNNNFTFFTINYKVGRVLFLDVESSFNYFESSRVQMSSTKKKVEYSIIHEY